MRLTASKLRENIYKVLDTVLETGKPVEIERRGKTLRIVAAEPLAKSKLDLLVKHPKALRCDPEEVVHLDWSSEWRP
ncbi:MAG: type II toxin-antitoxin system Phd/YefM family antitoxin [Planctomycetes bacterium]|nr:type II toxin-antitoxin system Phd/YefM family antitoxin [Planctomycetota bacterium]